MPRKKIILAVVLVSLAWISGTASAHGIAGGLPLSNAWALTLGLTVALMWGLVPVVTKRGYSYGGSTEAAISVIVITGVVAMWGGLLLLHLPELLAGRGISSLMDVSPVAALAFLAGGFLGTAVGRIAMYIGVDRVGANITSGVIATNSLPALVLGYLFLQETITPLRILGIGIIISGLVVLSLSKGGDIRGWQARDLVAPLTAAVAFGSGHVLRRFGLTLKLPEHSSPLVIATPLEAAAINEVAAAIGILAYACGYKRAYRDFLTIPRKAYVYFVIAGIISAIGLYVEFQLLVHEKAAIVTALVATQAVFATVFSYFLIGDLERITRKMVAAILTVVVGLVLIGF